MPTVAQRSHLGPAFLRGLNDVTDPGDGTWIARCPVDGCPDLLTISPGDDGHWQFDCDGPHTHQEIADHLHADTALDQEATRRIWRAVVLSPSLEICRALLAGEHVPPSQLDPLWIRRLGIRP